MLLLWQPIDSNSSQLAAGNRAPRPCLFLSPAHSTNLPREPENGAAAVRLVIAVDVMQMRTGFGSH